MTKIIKSKYKASRKLGVAIWGSSKDAFNHKNYRPGQHGVGSGGGGGGGSMSNYGLHLKAKQRIKAHYGRVKEKQLVNIFNLAKRKKGNTGDNFISLLESRIDVVVYRLNFSPTIFSARQIVTHKHIKINGKVINTPSQRLKVGDIIELTDKAKNILNVAEALQKLSRSVPNYLELDKDSYSGKFLRIPSVNDVPFPFDPQISTVVEFYSH